ncbi:MULTISPECIES: hypothetical protein [unclassified Kitasatospora]|uniref:hypothetical protein n=1 Tax=unclassified Kitasatospora TaxID=2633591 RepID=UPI001F376454|nr:MULTISPECIES: hypothetical protein [unclassified Kitasatospora]
MELPQLYREVEYVLGPTMNGRGERVSGSRNSELMFNDEASAVRTAMLGVLASWAGVVTELTAGAAPAREVGPLAAFLLPHLDVLADHPAAADLAEEIGALVVQARRVLQPPQPRRITLGRCPRAECASPLEARMGDGGDVRCRSGHAWSSREWLALRGSPSVHGADPTPAGRRLPTRLAAQAAGVSEATVRKWASRGKLTRHGSAARAEYDIDELIVLATG